MRLHIFGKGIDDDIVGTYDNMDRLNRRRAGFLSTADVSVWVKPRMSFADEKNDHEGILKVPST